MPAKPKIAPPTKGPPRWTHVVGAIVAACAFLWGIFVYFNPKADAPKLPAAAVAAPTSSVNVEGAGNVGIGTMSGGSVSVETPAKTNASATSKGAALTPKK